MDTQIFYETFKGYPVLAIWEVSNGVKKGKAPIVSFGLKKAKAIMENLEAIQTWIQDQEKPKTVVNETNSSSVRIDLSSLSPEQMASFKKFMAS